MTTPDPDAFWRRPAEGEPVGAAGADQVPAESGAEPEPGYPGPPPSTPPPPGWRTPVVAEPHPPRPLPEQDHAALDAAERDARTFTYGVGILAGAVVVVLLFVICARILG